MLAAQRQARIIHELQKRGCVEIAELSGLLEVDRSTVRRDLANLSARGLVERTRGGALPGPSVGLRDIPYKVKRIERTPEKQAIGRAAAALVREGDTVLLDSGSTTYQIALALRQHASVSVVTNDLNVAMCLADSPGVRLVVAGGTLLDSVYALNGPQTVHALRDVRVDKLFLGADAIHHESGITNVTFVEVEVKQAMIAAAREVVVVADSSKFERHALARVCTLEEIDLIITDDQLDDDVRSLYDRPIELVAPTPAARLDGRVPLQ